MKQHDTTTPTEPVTGTADASPTRAALRREASRVFETDAAVGFLRTDDGRWMSYAHDKASKPDRETVTTLPFRKRSDSMRALMSLLSGMWPRSAWETGVQP